ncbi:MAG: TlpA disulfide reductase family protein [Bacteroidota bacterium]
MKLSLKFLLLFCLTTTVTYAQDDKFTELKLGDPAPLLTMQDWIKGDPIKTFEKGRVYVIEFWATWCAPCNAEMPHLSAIAHKYKDNATVLSIDVYEKKTTSLNFIKAFVREKGDNMSFTVAIGDTNHTVHDWLEATGEAINGIPRTFIVDGQGKLAWVGAPKDMDEVLPKILNNKWNIQAALSAQNSNNQLRELDIEAGIKLGRFDGDYYKTEDLGHPDSALLVINELIKKDARIKYAPTVVLFTFSALLKTNLYKAYAFGKKAIVTPTYEEPAYCSIIATIDEYSLRVKMSREIFRLGAEALKQQIQHAAYPELLDMPKLYHKMAYWYLKAGDKSKAVEAERVAKKLVDSKFKNTDIMPSELTLLKLARQ